MKYTLFMTANLLLVIVLILWFVSIRTRAQTLANPTNVTISEVHYHAHNATATEIAAGGSSDDDDYDFIEFANLSGSTVLMQGCTIGVGISLTLGNFSIPAHGRAVVVRNLPSFQRRYGTPPTYVLPTSIRVIGQYSGRLANGGEQLVFRAANASVIKDFSYNDSGSWPSRPDGIGASLEILDVAGDYNDGDNWRGSREFGGSPGTAGTGPIETVFINEILAHSDAPYTDFIELHNPGTTSIDISGWRITDDPNGNSMNRFIVSSGTVLAPDQYLVFNAFDFNASNPANPLRFSEYGESVYLIQFTGGKPVAFADDVTYMATDVNVSLGRHTNSIGDRDFVEMNAITLGPDPSGAPNGDPRVGPLVLSEIMYGPASNEYEYVEIRNISSETVRLWDASPAAAASTNKYWSLGSGVDFTFGVGNQILPGEYIVVAGTNTSLFRTRYAVPNHVQVFGPYLGSLNNNGETVRLRRPGAYDAVIRGNPTVQVDRVTYDDLAPWPLVADGGGPSLERLDFAVYGNEPTNWIARNSQGSPGGPPQVDGDGDGVVDNWEYAFFATLANQNFASVDRDGDGQTDHMEYVAGTNPLVPGGAIRLAYSSATTGLRLSHPTVRAAGPGYYGRTRRYALQGTAGLLLGAWDTLQTVDATGGVVEHDPGPLGSRHHYRIEVLLP